MRSMTGFGRGEASNADGTLAFRVEISSVNRKQFELKFNLPRDMVSCEGLIRQAVAARISRGALTLRVEVVSAKMRRGRCIEPPTARMCGRWWIRRWTSMRNSISAVL